LMSLRGNINYEVSEVAGRKLQVPLNGGRRLFFPIRAHLCHLVVIGGPTVFDKHVTSDRNVMWCRDPYVEL